ncbi:soluble lytic murein transglycosylase-like protein [Neorhizobium sp. 2083]|uniref:lytic transglycosylase domain-containing protein n=1 Tax=Neorhizobium sp. 2083 TaxID=2817762 RepID=UPI002866B885|nr:lytic transglycosylase domain-containing protein [Neorhizobium sp. 2083]MDR6819796.1 soluble lytic murein transglycosylase-like protein [Neorhizobium sp. 2083]
MLAPSPRHLDQVGIDYGGLDSERPGEAAGSTRARRQRAVLSPMSVFSFNSGAVLPLSDPRNDADAALMQPRPDLRSGMPHGYTKLALTIAAEEGVDPNWVLSIMRAENAGFDPQLVSSTGAIGLMQVMPKIGEAFGAHDLTDPEQNIRAGTRFLRVLIDKYGNPVLIASAYNAGEPRVDAHWSLPLIRETADYVTRVVGYYTGAADFAPTPQVGRPSRPDPSQPGRIRPAGRARSPMLVFSSADPHAPETRLHQVEEANQLGSPLKIVKEEVHQ